MTMPVFPQPRRVESLDERLDLRRLTRIVFNVPSDRLKPVVHQIANKLAERTGQAIPVSGHTGGEGPEVRISIGTDAARPQGYRLAITAAGLEVEGNSESGLFYGLVTLEQFLDESSDRTLAGRRIEDWPDFAQRGLMIDVSRCKVPRLSTLKLLVDRMAQLKLNELQLYMEHTFAFPAHEVVWGDSSPYTAEDIRELDVYCRDRYVELVPNFNSFGHFERWLVHPEYRYLAETEGNWVDPWGKTRAAPATLRPDEGSIAFLEGLYADLLPNFTSERFNIGCDETWELGQGVSRERCERDGKHRVYLEHLQRIGSLAGHFGRRPQFWADIILERPEMVAEIPETVTGMIWGYEADHPLSEQCRRFAASGRPFYVVPGTSTWNTLAPRWNNARKNLTAAARAGSAFAAEGYLITDWGDNGHHQTLPSSLLGWIQGAGVSWNAEAEIEESEIASVIDRFWFGESGLGLGDCILRFGSIHRLIEKRQHNRSVFHDVFFGLGEKLTESVFGTKIEEWDAVANELRSIQDRLSHLQAKGENGILGIRELALSLKMVSLACRRAQARLNGKKAEAALRGELTQLIGEYEAVWIRRNRIGGLYESSGYLRTVLAETE